MVDGSVVVVGNMINGGFGKIDMLFFKINVLFGI